MEKYKWIIILFNLVLLLVLFNHSIVKKESTLSEGKLVLLKLAPVDPRSLMQGDYMALRYEISQDVEYNDSIPKRGYCVVRLDSNGIASRVRFQEDKTPLSKNEHLLNYTRSRNGVNIGAESFFFEEGQGTKFDSAKYGGIKIDDRGNSILIGLYNEALRKIN